MDYKQYQELALRTAGEPDFGMSALTYNLLHGALGLTTEIGEYFENTDEEIGNLKEELGDKFWYLNLACYAMGYDISNLNKVYLTDELSNKEHLVIWNAKLADVVKRHLFYKKPIIAPAEADEKTIKDCEKVQKGIKQCLEHIYSAIIGVIDEYDLGIHEILEMNIEKLRIRFPKKFDADKALNRDTEKEAQVFAE